MSFMAPLMLFGWPIVALAFFSLMPARRAVMCTLIGGWLFLPMAGYTFPGFPDYSKVTAASLAALLGVILFDGSRLGQLRVRWFDLPVLIWCLVPIPSAVTAGTGLYAGLSAALVHSIAWGVPYLLGRLYFADMAGLRELALSFFVGGLIYMPLCLIESVKGPFLHWHVYGFMQHTSLQAWRYSGWRPMVFLQHGLATGFWMAMATVAGAWLWRGGAKRVLWGVPMSWWVGAMFLTTVLCRSSGAWVLLAAAVAVYAAVRRANLRVALIGLVLFVPFYGVARTTQVLTKPDILNVVGKVFPASRTSSLEARLHQEDVLTSQAMQRPIFGWGPWGAYRSEGVYIKAVDALWLIAFGKYGLVGIASLMGTILLPALRWGLYVPVKAWLKPGAAAGTAAALILVLYMMDCLSNAMPNPAFMLAAGGVGFAAQLGPVKVRAVRVATQARPGLNAQ